MDMTNFFKLDDFWQFQDVNLWRLVISFTLSAGLSWILTILYKKTYRGSGYTQTMAHTLILLSCIVSLVMIVIGSNIARAFSLVGALSIIRFRTAVRSTRDTTFIFLTLAIGMAAGSRFYATAVVATILFSILILILHYVDVGGRKSPAQILKIRLPVGFDPEQVLSPVLFACADQWSVVSRETVQLGSATDITYQVMLKSRQSVSDFMEQLRLVNENQKITIYEPDRETSF